MPGFVMPRQRVKHDQEQQRNQGRRSHNGLLSFLISNTAPLQFRFRLNRFSSLRPAPLDPFKARVSPNKNNQHHKRCKP